MTVVSGCTVNSSQLGHFRVEHGNNKAERFSAPDALFPTSFSLERKAVMAFLKLAVVQVESGGVKSHSCRSASFGFNQ